MTGEPTIHADAVATIFRLINIAWGPGPLQKHNLTGAMQGESQATTAIGREEKIRFSGLKAIHRSLTLLRFLLTGQQFTAQLLLQELQW